jgi:predicted flap endonuclease-1-like 5' DNA nuclease
MGPAELAALDARLGVFQGRPERDRWQEQARLLAAGDVKGFERLHGKLGPEA